MMVDQQKESNLKSLSDRELLEQASQKPWADLEDDSRWDLIRELHRRPNDEVFRRAAALCEAEDYQHRALGAAVLAKLGVMPPNTFPFREASLPMFRALLLDDQPEVISAAIFGLREQGTLADFERIVELAKHPSPRVRFAVASALPLAETAAELKALIELSTDADESVRDWATFGLGLSEVDTPEVRAAFWARVGDPNPRAHEEALAGLAALRDPEVVPLLIGALKADSVSRLMLETAEGFADPRLLESLRELETWWDLDPPLMAKAIEACS